MVFEDELANYINSKQVKISQSLGKPQKFKYKQEYYKVKKYLDDFLDGKEGHRVIVMPGLRGVGKTTILNQLCNYLLTEKNINYKDVLYIQMDQIMGYFNTNTLKFIDVFLETIHNTTQVYLDKKLFIFVDECHFDKMWGLAGKIVYDNTNNIFLVFTGSSALEMEINPDITRRISKQTIFPNNFKDYLYLKHNIKIGYNFSKALENLIYFGEEKYLKKAIDLEKNVQRQLIPLNNYPNIEFNNFLKTYGLASTLKYEKDEAYEEIVEILNKVIDKDIPSIRSFQHSTTNNIRRMLIYLALQRPGSTSIPKIANYLSISPKLVQDIFDTLEKTQVIFNIKPYGGVGKLTRKPWKYYFLSPSLKSALNHDLGRFNSDSKQCLGALAENYVASTFFKMNQMTFKFMGIFYPTEKGGTDFLLRTKLDDMVPIEVGIGRKTKSQLVKAINKYDSEFGVLISNRHFAIKKENDIIHIPLTSFGFI